MSRYSHLIAVVAFVFTMILAAGLSSSTHPSYSDQVPVDTVPFYPDGTYDQSVPKPNDYLAHPIGEWPLRYNELVDYIEALAAGSDRVIVEKHGKTYEGRDLYAIIIGLPEYIADIETIREKTARLASANLNSSVELDALLADLPATAWMGYGIHGDEVSGVDGAVQLAYQLAAGTDSATMHLLRNVVVIIDPTQNPDGRERYMSMLLTYRSHVPNYDREAQQHGGVWPWGRGNHYLFDMNRDWVVVTQPETEGRLSTLLKWNPQLMVDGHEMGSSDNFLFSPPRQPVNYNTPQSVFKWWEVVSRDQAQAFDKRGWPYYVKEWHEHWYPGYGSSWLTFSGGIGVLYEQAGVDGSMVRQPNGYVLTYHEAVNHQFTSSLANLHTLANNRTEILRDYYNTRRDIIRQGEKSGLTYLFAPIKDDLKMNRFIESLLKQGIKVEKATADFTVRGVRDIMLNEHASQKFPAGTYIVRTSQIQGGLAKAILEFDPHLKLDFLKEERRELEKYDETRMYEVSAWSVPVAYNLDAYETTTMFSVATEPVTAIEPKVGKLYNPDAQFGFVIDMVGERTYLMLNKLFGKELVIYASEKRFTVEGRSFNAGALVVRKRGNVENLPAILEKMAAEIGLDIYGVNTGLATEGSYLGAPTFRLLIGPKVALLTGMPLDFSDFGAIWYAIDRELAIPHSLIQLSELAWHDLAKFNVIVIPSAWGQALGHYMGKEGASALAKWVEDGGTLICTGNAAIWAADSSNNLSQVRLKCDMLDKLGEYKELTDREIRAEAPTVDTMALWHPDKVAPLESKDEKQPPASKEELKKIDEWQRRFFPRGTILRVDLDTEDWLAFGMTKSVPAIVYTRSALMAGEDVKTVGRFSVDETKLRLSGLLWPEARQRWAGTAYLTREYKGGGQIIMFLGTPNLRAYFQGTRQMLANAILYGPGMGSWSGGPYEQKD
ncbi:MAG: M14 metallopeptidase family protein [Candidatus Zixiibacteriota bacterium]